jgi:hypothetical protein
MPKHSQQVAYLRRDVGVPIAFGDEQSETRYLQEREQARAAMQVPYAVAPRAHVMLADGTRLDPGVPVTLEMLQGFLQDGRTVPPQRMLRVLIRDGKVLER